MNVTLDGFISGPHCELDWHFKYWNEEMSVYAAAKLRQADTIVLGKVTFRAMSQHWPLIANNFAYPREDIAFADMMNSYRKLVFSASLPHDDPAIAEWPNTTVSKRNATLTLGRLKQLPGKDLIIFGSGRLAASLIADDMINDYLLWVHPVVLGNGKRLFPQGEMPQLTLTGSHTFESGVVVLSYANCQQDILKEPGSMTGNVIR